jgi:hypothetical protein
VAIYSLDVGSAVLMRDSLLAAFSAAGILTTTHYTDTDSCIVTLTRCDRVLRWNINPSYRTLLLSFGDAWVSGDAITNAVSVTTAPVSGIVAQAVLIVTGDVVAYVARDNTSKTYSFVLCQQSAPATDYLILAWSTGLGAGAMPTMYNTTLKEPIHLGALTCPALTATGNYYQHEWIVMNSGYGPAAGGVRGCLALAKATDNSATHVVYGDDVVIPCLQANNQMTYTPNSCLIIDGNSWAPAP